MAQRNIFEAGAVEVNQLFGDYLDGNIQPGTCVALVLSKRPLNKSACTAIENSLAALDFGKDNCAYATMLPIRTEAEGADIPLDAQSLFLLVEGLDPLRIIGTDQKSTALLSAAYRTSFPYDAAIRIFGRPAVVFQNLEQMLETPDGKQKAWALFKTLA